MLDNIKSFIDCEPMPRVVKEPRASKSRLNLRIDATELKGTAVIGRSVP